MNDQRIVAAELTPRGTGGVSVIELRGASALARVEGLLTNVRLVPGNIRVARLSADGEELDECLVHCIDPQSVEVHLHGNPALVRRVLRAFDSRPSEPALAARDRARELLASAPCEAAARLLLDQAEGALERAVEAWRELDDPSLRLEIERVLARSRAARFALRPAVVVLAGPVNAGKSTLFNLLVGRERVAVSSVPGTTRDLIVERVAFGAWPVDLVDTAGDRTTLEVGELERAGIGLARDVRDTADLVLWLSPVDGPAPAPTLRAATVELHTRASRDELNATSSPARIGVHADPIHAARRVIEAFRSVLALPDDPWIPGAPLAFDAMSLRSLEACHAALFKGSRATADEALCALLRGRAR